MKNITCDVLIVGGGIGGLSCAVTLKELHPEHEILVIEKNFAGYAGKANRGGGVLQYFDPNKIEPRDFAFFHAKEIGEWLGDQEMLMQYVAMNKELLDMMSGWGVNVPKNEDGTYNVMPTGPQTAMICVDLDITLKVRSKAEKLGVKFMDKTTMTELLTDGDKISGAVVMNLLDGEYGVIGAKRVVLATGSQNYRLASMWSSGRGDGIAAAYRAGAQMRNAEFGNFAQLVKIRSHNEVVFGENFMHNAKGEFITPNFCKKRETDISSRAIREWYKQMIEGNGPVHLVMGPPPGAPAGAEMENPMEKMWKRPYGEKFRKLNDGSGAAVDTDLEVCPLLIGEQSPIKVGRDMQTTLKGLYAVGDCSYCGSGAPGAVPAPPGRNRGSGILNAVFAAVVCARAIAEDKDLGEAGHICDKQVEKAVEWMNAPLNRAEGCDPKEVIYLIQQAMGPVENSVIMKQERMEKAMEIVNKAEELSKTMKATDPHGLLSCIEAEAMVLSAKMHFTASMERKESRGWFMREEYPEMDNINWLKYVILQNKDGKMEVSTEDVPIMDYPAKPVFPLTEEQKASPLYKYWTRPLTQADPKKYEACQEPMDPAIAHQAPDLNLLFDDGYLPGEQGYCSLPDGTATLANLTFMPGVTPEMFDWWFAWHGLEEMRYKIWDPEDHVRAITRNPEIALDKSLSMKERLWNTTHDVDEDCGMGVEHITIYFRNPAEIGFDPEKLKDFKGSIVCSGNEKSGGIMVHFLRPVEGGCELRTRFWMGYSVIGGKPVKILPPGVKIPVEPVKALLMHNIKEFTNLAAILPEVYAEFHEGF